MTKASTPPLPQDEDLQKKLDQEVAQAGTPGFEVEEEPDPADEDINSLPTPEFIGETAPAPTTPKTTPAEQGAPTPDIPKAEVRTFHQDVSHLTDTDSANATAGMLRESRTKEAEKKALHAIRTKTRFLIGMAVLFCIATVAVLWFAFRPNTTPRDLVARLEHTSIVRSDSQRSINVTGATSFKATTLVEDAFAEGVEDDTIRSFYFGVEDNTGGRILATAELFQALNIRAPQELLEVAHEAHMVGIYKQGDRAHPFLLLPVTSYPRAFKAMRAWEPTMLVDIAKLFALPETYVTPEARAATFSDQVAVNKTLRVLAIPIIGEETRTVEVQEGIPDDVLIEQARLAEEARLEQEARDKEALENLKNQEATSEESDETTTEETSEPEPSTDVPPDTATESGNYETVSEEEVSEEAEEPEPAPQYATQTVRTQIGEEVVLVYSFINENALLITTDPVVIPEITRRYANRVLFQ